MMESAVDKAMKRVGCGGIALVSVLAITAPEVASPAVRCTC
jgi:hypothetical protein